MKRMEERLRKVEYKIGEKSRKFKESETEWSKWEEWQHDIYSNSKIEGKKKKQLIIVILFL